MDHIGIDVHKRESQIDILAQVGVVIEQRIRTAPERFAAALGSRPRARIPIEASTESEWVAWCLEALGQPSSADPQWYGRTVMLRVSEVLRPDLNVSPVYWKERPR